MQDGAPQGTWLGTTSEYKSFKNAYLSSQNVKQHKLTQKYGNFILIFLEKTSNSYMAAIRCLSLVASYLVAKLELVGYRLTRENRITLLSGSNLPPLILINFSMMQTLFYKSLQFCQFYVSV